VSVEVARQAQFLITADFNSDGLADIATVDGFFQSTISIFLNDGDWPSD
jgi:hypothetical protein